MFAFLASISAGLVLSFLIIPAVLIFILQIWLCFKVGKLILKLIPVILAVIVCALVFLCSGTGFLSFLIGGFVGLLLLCAAGAIIMASIVGWAIYAIVRCVAGK